MRPLILVPTIISRHWNACYLQLLSVQRCQHPPQAERCCWGGGPDPPSSRRHWTQLSRLFAAAAASHLGSCFSGTLDFGTALYTLHPLHPPSA